MPLNPARFLSRKDWGARPPKRQDTNFTKTGGAVIHYTTRDAAGLKMHWPDCYKSWRAHQNFHMDTRGWYDLAYNFGVCPHGFVFEGRGWTAQNGANRPENSSTFSIAVDFDSNDEPIPAIVLALNELISEAAEVHGWAPRVRGHRDISSTSCPGDILYELVSSGTVAYKTAPPPDVPDPTIPDPTPGGYAIVQPPTTTIAQMQRWAQANNSSMLFVALAVFAWNEGVRLGIDPAVVYALMAHETAFGRFGGVLDVSFCNWGGIKTSGGGGNFDPNAHHRFDTHAQGVRAVAQHIAIYAGVRVPPEEVVDPRHFDSIFGKAPTLPNDGWTWAAGGHDENVLAKVTSLHAA